MKMTYIYGLYVTENNIRYVGKTDNLKKRLYEHILNSKYKKTHKDIWVQKELNNGNTIKIVLLEEVFDENWKAAEIKWMEYYKTNNLTNHAKGGMGGRQEVYTISYDDAKLWIKESLNCKSGNNWNSLIKTDKIPDFIPKSPYEHYKNKGWISWGDFLGTNKTQDNLIISNYVSYENAKAIVKKTINATTEKEWKKLAKENKIPNEIPNRPRRFYEKRGWISWGDFLNTNRVANQNKEFLSYQGAVDWLKKSNVKLNSIKDWKNFCKKENPSFLPLAPDKAYKENGWISWNIFLGNNNISDNLKHINYVLFEDAVTFARSLHLHSRKEWEQWHTKNKPDNMPFSPRVSYKKDWKGILYFLGKKSKSDRFLNYDDAKKYMKQFNLKSYKQFIEWIKQGNCPKNIPKKPYITYKRKGWKGFDDFLWY